MHVLLAIKSSLARIGMETLLGHYWPKAQISKAGAQALAGAAAARWDLVILEADPLSREGLAALVELKRACPAAPLLVLGPRANGLAALTSVQAGAAGYVPAGAETADLVTAIDAAFDLVYGVGQSALPAGQPAFPANLAATAPAAGPQALSPMPVFAAFGASGYTH